MTLGFVRVMVRVTVSVLLMLALGSGVSDRDLVTLFVSDGGSVSLAELEEEIVSDAD